MKAIGTQLRDPINSGLTRWRLTVCVDAVAESGRTSLSKHHIDDLASVRRMGGLTRDGTAEPVSRDQILGREKCIFSCPRSRLKVWSPRGMGRPNPSRETKFRPERGQGKK